MYPPKWCRGTRSDPADVDDGRAAVAVVAAGAAGIAVADATTATPTRRATSCTTRWIAVHLWRRRWRATPFPWGGRRSFPEKDLYGCPLGGSGSTCDVTPCRARFHYHCLPFTISRFWDNLKSQNDDASLSVCRSWKLLLSIYSLLVTPSGLT